MQSGLTQTKDWLIPACGLGRKPRWLWSVFPRSESTLTNQEVKVSILTHKFSKFKPYTFLKWCEMTLVSSQSLFKNFGQRRPKSGHRVRISMKVKFGSKIVISFSPRKGMFTDLQWCPDPMTGVCIEYLLDTGSQPVRPHQHPKLLPSNPNPGTRFNNTTIFLVVHMTARLHDLQ